MGEVKDRIARAADRLAGFASAVGGEISEIGRTCVSVLTDPARALAHTTAGTSWRFPLTLIIGSCLLHPVLLRFMLPDIPRVFGASYLVLLLCEFVFLVALGLAALLGARLSTGQRVGLVGAMNCVAVALVPLSLFMAIAWIVVSFLPALSLFIMLFALLVAFCYFAEALTGQCEFAVGVGLYAIPLMLTVALLVTALFLWALFGVTKADEEAMKQTVKTVTTKAPRHQDFLVSLCLGGSLFQVFLQLGDLDGDT